MSESKEVVSFGGNAGLPANPDDLIKGLQNVGQTLQGSSGGVPFLRLLKSGRYAYGAENIEPEEDSLWAMNPNSLQHGWACWVDSELLGEAMVPFTQAAPARAGLPDYGGDWKQQVSMVLQCLNGEDEGVSVLYKGTSVGLHNAVKLLINDLVRQLQTDPKHCVPVLALECDSYNHKKHGEIFYPVLTIEKWVAFDGAVAEAAKEAVTDQSGASEAADDAKADDKGDDRPRRGRSASGGRRGRAGGGDGDGESKDDAGASDANAEGNGGGSRRRRRRRG